MFWVRQLTNRWAGSWKPHHRKSYWSVPVFIAIHLSFTLSGPLSFFTLLSLSSFFFSCSLFHLYQPWFFLFFPLSFSYLFPFDSVYSVIHCLFCASVSVTSFFSHWQPLSVFTPQSAFFLQTSSCWNFVIDSCTQALQYSVWFMNKEVFRVKICGKWEKIVPTVWDLCK